MSRVAIYSRVSTRDRGQDAENQARQLREWCTAGGHEIVHEFTDQVSGSKGQDRRPGLAAMLDAAHRHEFDIVLVWSLDRLTREGMVAAIGYLQRLDAAGVGFVSYTEPALSTANRDELSRSIVLAVMAALAKVERQRIADRTRAGLDRIKATIAKRGEHVARSGRCIRRLGRPALDQATQFKIATMAAAGASNYAIGKTLGLDPKTVTKYRPPPADEAAD